MAPKEKLSVYVFRKGDRFVLSVHRLQTEGRLFATIPASVGLREWLGRWKGELIFPLGVEHLSTRYVFPADLFDEIMEIKGLIRLVANI